MAYFAGRGYSAGFTAHMDALLRGLTADTPVLLVAETDAVCAACPNNRGGLCETPELVAGYDQAVLERCGLEENAQLPFGAFTALVQERVLSPGLRRAVCGGCQWSNICDTQPSRWAK